jgi:hypothetical protein
MKLGRWYGLLITLAGAGLLVLPALAQDAQKWEWKAFAPKSEYYQELKTDTTQTMKVMGQDVKQTQEQTFFIKWTGQEPKDKALVVQQKIIGVNMKIDIGGVNIAYNSLDEKQANNPMTDFFKKLLEADLKLHVDADKMVVKKIEGQDELVKKLGVTNPQMEPLLKSILSEEALKQMAEPTWGAFPTDKVKKGDTWTKKSTLNLGPIGTYDTEYKYTLEGPDKGGEKIKIDATLTYSPPKDKAGGLPFQIKSATLKSKEGTGHAIFDKTKGRIESSTMTMKLEGTLDIEVGGMTTTVELSQTQTATVRSMDADPTKTKK